MAQAPRFPSLEAIQIGRYSRRPSHDFSATLNKTYVDRSRLKDEAMSDNPAIESARTAEGTRLTEARDRGTSWNLWGPYLSERQWGTVREGLQ